MDFFDIVWLVVCIGLPIVSGIVSSGKKRKARPVPPGGKRDIAADLKDVFRSIGDEIVDANTKYDPDEDDDEEADEWDRVGDGYKTGEEPEYEEELPSPSFGRPVLSSPFKPLQPRPVVPQQNSRKETSRPVMKEETRKSAAEAVPVNPVPVFSPVLKPVRPALEKTAAAPVSATVSVRRPAAVPLNMMTASSQRAETLAKSHAADAVHAGAIGSNDEGKQTDRERIDAKKLIEYNAIMNPAFKEY